MKKCPSFKNEIIYRFIIDFLCRFIPSLSFSNDTAPSFSIWQMTGQRFGMKFISDSLLISEWRGMSVIPEALQIYCRRSCRFIGKIISEWKQNRHFQMRGMTFILKGIQIYFSLFLRFTAYLFGMIRGSLRYDLSSLWLPAPSFRKRGDLLLIITEEISYFYHLKGRIFRLKINAVKWCKTVAWIFWKSGHFRREKSLQKSFRNLLISIGKSFLRLLIESHKKGQIIGELRFFRTELRFLSSVCPFYPTSTPVFWNKSLS